MSTPKVAVEFWAQILLKHVQISTVKLQCFKPQCSQKILLWLLCIPAVIQLISKTSEALQVCKGQYQHPHWFCGFGGKKYSSLCSLWIPRCSIAVLDYFYLEQSFSLWEMLRPILKADVTVACKLLEPFAGELLWISFPLLKVLC